MKPMSDNAIPIRLKSGPNYQNGRLAKRYRKLVDQVSAAAKQGGYDEALPRAVAINYAKLLAYKDEYEVARLFTDGAFEQQLRDQFEGDFKFSFNLAPPILSRGVDALSSDPATSGIYRVLPGARRLLEGVR